MENTLIEEKIENETELDQSFDKKKQSRRFILTINNPTESDEEMETYLKELEHFKYAIFQREKGHETGTEHFQIFIIFSICKRFGTLQNLFPRAHIEPAKGTNVQCRDYCSKSDTRVSGPYEIGEFAEERSRSDIKGFTELIKSGADNMTLLELYPTCYMRYHNMIEDLRQDMLENELKDKVKENYTCIYIYGESRIGKTRSLFEKYGTSGAYFVSDYKNHPFDDYKNQDVMVFDEFRSQLDFSQFLKLSDLYPLHLSRRFKNIVGNYTKLFVISNIPLEKQYENMKTTDYDSYRGFPKRFHFILKYEKNRVVVEKIDEFHKIEELKNLLPERIYNMIDMSKLPIRLPTGEQLNFFTDVDTDELPF